MSALLQICYHDMWKLNSLVRFTYVTSAMVGYWLPSSFEFYDFY